MTAIAFDGELRARCRVHELGHRSPPTELDDAECSDDVEVVHRRDILEARRNARVFAQVVDDVRRFAHETIDVLRVALAILSAGDVVLASAVRIIIERDHAIAWISDELLDDVRADVTGAAGHEDRTNGHEAITRRPGGRSSDT